MMGRLNNSQPNPAPPLASRDAFGRVYETTYLHVFRYLFGLTGGPRQEVEDLTAETFHRAWRARNRFIDDEANAIHWLLRIGKNLVIDTYRRQQRWGTPEDIDGLDIPAPMLPPETRVEQQEEWLDVCRMLAGLKETPREIIVLRYILGWRVKDIAAFLDRPENTVSVIIRRSLEKLRKGYMLHERSG